MRASEIELLFESMYWANHRLLDAAEGLPPEHFTQPTEVTTRDLRATLVHELDVEWSWRLNLQGAPEEQIGEDAELRPESYPTVAALREHWARDEAEMLAWLRSLTDEDVQRPVPSGFTRDRRPLWQYLVHILTHAQQQQADAATLLTRAGHSPGELGFLEYLKSHPGRQAP